MSPRRLPSTTSTGELDTTGRDWFAIIIQLVIIALLAVLVLVSIVMLNRMDDPTDVRFIPTEPTNTPSGPVYGA